MKTALLIRMVSPRSKLLKLFATFVVERVSMIFLRAKPLEATGLGGKAAGLFL